MRAHVFRIPKWNQEKMKFDYISIEAEQTIDYQKQKLLCSSWGPNYDVDSLREERLANEWTADFDYLGF